MKEIKPNYASDRMKKLIKYLQQLENVDYQRMSKDGRYYLDKIWSLLKLPTNKEMLAALDAKNKQEEE